jgi:hypothetical protein
MRSLIFLGLIFVLLTIGYRSFGQSGTSGLGPIAPKAEESFGYVPTDPPRTSSDNVDPGDVIKPKAKLLVRAAPPGGILGLKAKVVGVAQPSTDYLVVEERDISSFIGSQKWLRIRPVASNLPSGGWVFSGYSNGNNSNVTVLGK